jgi:hypothetical protein
MKIDIIIYLWYLNYAVFILGNFLGISFIPVVVGKDAIVYEICWSTL